MKQIIDIIMKRDGYSYDDAKALVLDTKEQVLEAIENGEFMEAEDIIMDNLMLEADYIYAFIM